MLWCFLDEYRIISSIFSTPYCAKSMFIGDKQSSGKIAGHTDRHEFEKKNLIPNCHFTVFHSFCERVYLNSQDWGTLFGEALAISFHASFLISVPFMTPFLKRIRPTNQINKQTSKPTDIIFTNFQLE